MKRLLPSIFKIPTDKLRTGYYTDRYFIRTRNVLVKDRRHVTVGYQFFLRDDAVVCGLDEAIAILKTCAGSYRDPDETERLYQALRKAQWNLQDASAKQNRRRILASEKERTRIREKLNRLWQSGWKQLKVFSLRDGSKVKKNQPVLAIVGDPSLFVHLETVLLGVIARPTATATAVAKVVAAAGKKQVLFFSARFDHYWVQTTDGYAALKAGAFGVSTDANADYWGIQSLGTVPHFLIGCYAGDTAEAVLAFDRHTDRRVNRIALVDWDNDCIGTTREVIERLLQEKYQIRGKVDPKFFLSRAREIIGQGKGKLWAVRLDTSGGLRDQSVRSRARNSFGVCPELVRKAKRAFKQWGCGKLKIIVSGGFDEKRIRAFERLKLPVNAYGVGSSLLRHRIDVTADIVSYEGRFCAKVGRKKGNWSKLERVR